MADAKQAAEYVSNLITRSREAQKKIEFATQEQVDDLCAKLAWSGVRPDFVTKFSNFAAEESGMGIGEDKVKKMMAKVKGPLRDMIGQKSVGIVERDEKLGLIKFAKPMGVVGALVPCTNPEATPFAKAMFAIKTRNSIILAPHPRTVKTNSMAIAQMRKVLADNGCPEDLIIGIDEVSVEASNELMKQCDVILATGGGGMVKAAYSSGTPAYGVGAGNAVVIIDETADIADAANKVKRSKIFDNATSCSTENSLIIQKGIYQNVVEALEKEGGLLIKNNSPEKERLQNVMWEKGVLSRNIVAQSAKTIAGMAGIEFGDDKCFIMVEEDGVGKEHPFSGEKLSPVTTLFAYDQFDDAVNMVEKLTTYSGPGHSCGIHTTKQDRVEELGKKAKVSRIMVRQPQCLANSGAWTNGMPMSLTLGCGSWGGNASSENITWKHLLNYTWVSCEIPANMPSDEELFGDIMKEA